MIDRLGFDNEKYLEMQSEHIRSRISQFGGKLYLEFGGKLFDDHHASRVLPGFHPDSKIRMLSQMKDQAEIVVAVSAMDLEKSKVRGDIGITYGADTLRLIDVFRGFGFQVNSVVLTRFSGQTAAELFREQLEHLSCSWVDAAQGLGCDSLGGRSRPGAGVGDPLHGEGRTAQLRIKNGGSNVHIHSGMI